MQFWASFFWQILTFTFWYQLVKPYKTSRFPYIGSWCVLRTVVTQYVMAAVCFQSMFSIFLAFNFLWFPCWATSPSVSPPYLCHLYPYLCVTFSVSHFVCHILCVTFCVSHFVCHILCVIFCVSHFVHHYVHVIFANYGNG